MSLTLFGPTLVLARHSSRRCVTNRLLADKRGARIVRTPLHIVNFPHDCFAYVLQQRATSAAHYLSHAARGYFAVNSVDLFY